MTDVLDIVMISCLIVGFGGCGNSEMEEFNLGSDQELGFGRVERLEFK